MQINTNNRESDDNVKKRAMQRQDEITWLINRG